LEEVDRRLLAAKADKLNNYVSKTPSRLYDLLASEVTAEKQVPQKKEDLKARLKTSIPALKGPFAGKPWIKYVLKKIGSIQWPV